MNSLLVEESKLKGGAVSVQGYKHASNLLICASIAIEKNITLKNVPNITDTRALLASIKLLGGKYHFDDNDILNISTSSINKSHIKEEISKLSHATIYLMPVLLGKFGKIKLGKTGGCLIGSNSSRARPVEHMIKVLDSFGANFKMEERYLIGLSSKFKSCTIDIFDFSENKSILTGPLVSGATKTAILASLYVRDGVTIIKNPYLKPDVTELLSFVSKSGFNVQVLEKEIRIKYVGLLPDAEISYELIDDISVIMTYITVALFHDISIKISIRNTKKVQTGLDEELKCLKRMKVDLNWSDKELMIKSGQKLVATDIQVTSVGIYSDHQPFFAILLTKCKDQSIITEHVWKTRFDYAFEVNKLAKQKLFEIKNNKMIINPGHFNISGKSLNAHDLRAAAVLLIVSLQLEGMTIIENIHHLERGYSNLLSNVERLGAKIMVI